VVGVHLHRFLAPALLSAEATWEGVDVALGFEGSSVASAWLRVSGQAGASALAEGLWMGSFEDLVRQWRARGVRGRQPVALRRAGGGDLGGVYVAALYGEPADEGGAPDEAAPIIGFITAPAAGTEAARAIATLTGLAKRAEDALRAARFNLIRLRFDEDGGARPPKDLLYEALALSADLCGVDHSAALILTNHLEAMTLDAAADAEFELVAERMFFDLDPTARTPERLVGLVIAGQGEQSGLLGAAFAATQRHPQTLPHLFLCDEEGRWYGFAEPAHALPRFVTRAQRPQEQMCVQVPLLHDDERGQRELFGFLSLNFRQTKPLGALDQQLMSALATRLARYLKHSPLFNLSARQMLLIERVRAAYNDSIGQGGAVRRMEAFIARVNAEMVAATALPCFAIGYVCALGGQPTLRFVHPQGFTRFQSINLRLNPGDATTESSVAALAVRLDRPLTLVAGQGGRAGSRNALYVHERSRALADGRMVDVAVLPDAAQWRRLADYYKPSREQSYATLAFPITLGHEPLGVVALEVDRDTDWFWWTGFGSQSFYRLLAAELAVAFKLMGVPHL
jgi:hypothetical protein